jgi:hypothetical protein
MQNITFTKIVDAEVLHQQMKAALGEDFIGVSVTGDSVIVHVSDTATIQQLNLVQVTIAAHDVTTLPPKPTPKSYEQRFAEFETRIQILEQKTSTLPVSNGASG